MKSLFLTNNPNLGSTSRILQDWLELVEQHGLQGSVVGHTELDFVNWLQKREIPSLVDPMPWFDKRQPWRAVWHAHRVARWAKQQQVDIIHTGIAVETNNLPALVSATASLVVDRSLRNSLGSAARERVRRVFNPEIGLKKVLAIYTKLSNPKPLAKKLNRCRTHNH